MTTKDVLKVLVDEIHTVVMATVDKEGKPVTRAMDLMLSDDNTFYFLTAKGKAVYEQLTGEGFVSLTGMTYGESSIEKKAVSIRGKVQDIGPDKLPEIFEKNPYMARIYPTKESRQALTVFTMTEGEGEYFDLSTRPITRFSFAVGKKKSADTKAPYVITDACIGCGRCLSVCPQNCINRSSVPYAIEADHCLHCGNCFTVCPQKAVVRR